jgi:branched-chain amino acid transport system substrate-binding protein
VLKPAGIEASQGIILALYRKDVTDPQWQGSPDVAAFKEFMAKYMPTANMSDDLHNYGYAVTHTLIEVLKRCGDNLTRENIMKQAASLQGFDNPLLLPGIKINTGAADFYPIQAVRLARVKGESFELFGDVLSSESE